MKTITYYILGNGFSYHYLLYFKKHFQNLLLKNRGEKPLLIRKSNVIKNFTEFYSNSLWGYDNGFLALLFSKNVVVQGHITNF